MIFRIGGLRFAPSVWRPPGGRWVSLGPSGSNRGGRWFRPERIMSRRLDLDAAADLTRRAILDAVRSRATGRVSVLLSGGRGLRDGRERAGARRRSASHCLTFQVPSGLGLSEWESARTLALESGHRWRAIPISASINDEDLEVLPTLNGPFGPPVFPYTIASLGSLAGHLPERRWRGSAVKRGRSVGRRWYSKISRVGGCWRQSRTPPERAIETGRSRTSHRRSGSSAPTFPRACWRPMRPIAGFATRLGGYSFRIPTPVCACSLIARLPPPCPQRAWAFGDGRDHGACPPARRHGVRSAASWIYGSFLSPSLCRIICGRPCRRRNRSSPALSWARGRGPGRRGGTSGIIDRARGGGGGAALPWVEAEPVDFLAKLGCVSEPLPSQADVAQWSSQVLRLLPLELWLRKTTDGDG